MFWMNNLVNSYETFKRPVYRCDGGRMERKTLNFPESMARKLEKRSDDLGISQGEIVRTALRNELEV